VTDHFKQEFRWLGMITGPVRDLDIYLLKFDEYTQELPPGLQNDLLPFQQFLQASLESGT
jgi:CHAD domain-containing protein